MPEPKSQSNTEKPPKTAIRLRPSPWVRYFVSGLLLIMVVSVAFYFLYVDKQKELQSYYLLRLLTTACQNVGETISGLKGNIGSVAKAKKPIEKEQDSTLKSTIEKKLDLIPSLIKGRFNEEFDLNNLTELEDPKVCVSIEYRNGDYFVEFSVHASNVKDEAFSAQAKLRDLLFPSLPDDVFSDGVIVAKLDKQDNEKVLLQKGGAAVQLMQLPREKLSEEGKSSAPEDSSITTQIRDVEIAGKKFKLFLQPFRLPIDIKWSNFTEQGNNNEKNILLMAGLISSSTFQAKTMEISPTIVLFVLFLLVVGFICLPFLRVRFIGLREGLKAHDVLIMAVVLILGFSLLTFAVIHALTCRTERNTRKVHLRTLAESISERASWELGQLEEQLKILTQEANTEYKINNTPDQPKKKSNLLSYERPNILSYKRMDIIYPHFEMVIGMDKNGDQKWKWSVKSETTGLLNFKNREYFTHARDYNLSLPCSGAAADSEPFLEGRYVQSIRSKTTGEVYIMLSKRMRNEDNTCSIVAVIEAPILSLINPVIPPGYGFSVIDKEGGVQFHSNPIRNLRENFFEELDSDEEARGAVFSGVEKYIDFIYRTIPRKAFISPLDGTPWTLVVFTERRILSDHDLETMTFSLGLYGIYFVLFLVASTIVYYFSRYKTLPGEARCMWFWPNKEKSSHYLILFLVMALFIVIWFVGNRLLSAWMVLISPAFSLILIVFVHILLGRKNNSQDKTAPLTKKATSRWWQWWCVLASKRWQGVYVLAVVGLLFNIAILPALSFYHRIHSEEAALFVKMHQLQLANSLRNRIDHHVERFRNIELSPKNRETIQKNLALPESSSPAVQKALDIYVLESESITESTSYRDIRRPAEKQSKQVWVEQLESIRLLPTYNKLAARTRALSSFLDADRNVTWSTVTIKSIDKIRLNFANFRPSVRLGKSEEEDTLTDAKQVDLKIDTPLDLLKSVSSPQIILALIVVAVFLLLWIVREIMRLVFITDMRYPLSFKGEDLIKNPDLKRQMRIRLLEEETQPATRLHQYPIGFQDIRTAKSFQDLLSRVKASPQTEILLTKFDYGLDDPEIARKKLELLEGLVTLEEKRIVIKSSIEPLFFLTSRAQDFRAEKRREQIPLDRWAAVLQRFAKLRWKATEGDISKLQKEFEGKLKAEIEEFNNLDKDVQDSLVSEGWPNSLLKHCAETLSSRKELENYTADDVVDQILDLAKAHYRRIWETCSTDEKVLLYRLSQEGFVNWQMKNTLHSLIRRRIVVATPNFRLMNESFRRFVLNAERPEVFQKWEEAIGASMWSRVKMPLILSGTVLVIFFFVTQREIFNQSLGMLAALLAGAPALIKVIGALTQSSPTSDT